MLTRSHDAKVPGVVVLLIAIYMMHHAALVYFAPNLFLRRSPMVVLPFAVLIEVLLIPMINARLRAQKKKIGEKREKKDGEGD